MINNLCENECKVVGGGLDSQCSVWSTNSSKPFYIPSMNSYAIMVTLNSGCDSAGAGLVCGNEGASPYIMTGNAIEYCLEGQNATISSTDYAQGHYCYLF
jgi:hypothetical protein